MSFEPLASNMNSYTNSFLVFCPFQLIFCLLKLRDDDKTKLRDDDKTKSIILNLITPAKNSQQDQHGSSKNKKETASSATSSKKRDKGAAVAAAATAPEPKVALFDGAEWIKDEKYDPEIHLNSMYRQNHGSPYSKKLLSRICMLHYIKQEFFRDLEAQVNAGVEAAMLPIQLPFLEKPPAPWWNAQADVSLLVGTYKHGYERYIDMRLDSRLCFVKSCPPGKPFPPDSVLNAHLRRLIAPQQRSKKEQAASSALAATSSSSNARADTADAPLSFFLTLPLGMQLPADLSNFADK